MNPKKKAKEIFVFCHQVFVDEKILILRETLSSRPLTNTINQINSEL
jgi:hypothetical protein